MLEIIQTDKDEDLLAVIEKLPEAKIEPMNKRQFARAVIRGQIAGTITVFVSLDENDQLRGCAVAEDITPATGEPFLWVIFLWAHKDEPEMAAALQEKLIELARSRGYQKLMAEVKRGFTAIKKKYGWREAYRVFEKTIESI